MISISEHVGKKHSKVIYRFSDPIKFCSLFWPQYTLYDKQKEIMYSVRDNYETVVPAGHELGKDFIAGLVVLWFFSSRRPCRVVTTGPNHSQLEDVLWGEIRRFLSETKYKLPIEQQSMKLYQIDNYGNRIPNSEAVGKVYQKGEGMLGRHAYRTIKNEPTTLLVVDEASGVNNDGYDMADTWTHRKLIIGNPYPCTNFFYEGTKTGDVSSERMRTGEEKLYRKVIRIRAEDSPNVKYALREIDIGKEPSNTELVPGVVRYSDYLQRRKVWDKVKQCIGLDAEFYEGAETLMFPPEWLNLSNTIWRHIDNRIAKAIGIDPAEGGDSTCYAAVDEYGLIELISKKTPDTSIVVEEALAFARKHRLQDFSRMCFDRGGGGKQHADRLRSKGYYVRTVGFGEPASKEPQLGMSTLQDRKLEIESRYAYRNKRAEIYGRLRLRLDPSIEETQFAIDPNEVELRRQLSPIPLSYDEEGRLKLPSKNKKNQNSREITLFDLIGNSPDEADAVALAVYGMEVDATNAIIGAIR